MIKNLGWTIIGNFSYSIVKWIILILFVRALAPSDVGEYTLALAFTAPFFLFSNMRLRTMYVVDDNNNFKEFSFIRIIIILLSIIIIGLLSYLFFNEYFHIFLLVSLIKAVELLSDLLYALPHKLDRLDLIGKILVSKSVGILLTVFFSIMFLDSLIYILGTYLAFNILFLIIEYKLCIRYFVNDNFQFSYIKIILISALPLGFVQFLSSVNVSHPKYFIEIFNNIELVGIFTSISYVLVIANLIMSSISQSYIVSIKNLINDNNYTKLKTLLYKKLSKVSLIITFFAVLLSYIFGDVFLEIIYGSSVADYAYILIILSFAIPFTFYSWMTDTILMAFEYYKVQPFIAIIVFVLSVPVTIFLIINTGILGATYSLLFIYIIQAILKMFFSVKIIRRREKDYESGILSRHSY